MPLDVKSQLVHCFFIRQVMCLLKKQSAKHRVQFFCRTAKIIVEKGGHFANGKFTEEFFLK